jgi:ATP-dependent helicase/nuclease subunit A
MSLTEEQKQAAQAQGSVSVLAGAGTGKTYMLAERYYFHLNSDGFSPLEVVAMTFTNKAAAELRSRIRQTIAQKAPDRADWLAEVEASQISTFHALATRICREHPEKAGVPADFTTLDEWEGDIWLADQLLSALTHIPQQLYTQIPYSIMKDAIACLLKDPISTAEALTKKMTDWLPKLEEAKREALEKLIQGEVWQEAVNCFQNIAGQSGDKIEEARQTALNAMEKIEHSKEISSYLEQISQIKLSGGSVKKWHDKEDLDNCKANLKSLKEVVSKALKVGLITLELSDLDQVNQELVLVLREAFTIVQERLAKSKHKQRILDFNDLEVYALKALNCPEVQSYYQQRWRAFLIDEFQDTNPTQSKFLEALTEKAIVTIVGDDKQSIYGFRRADVRVFHNWRSRLQQSVSLTKSFRTHHNLIENINTIFAPVLEKLHQDLEGDRKQAPHPAPHIETFIVNCDQENLNITKRREIEAQQIAESIKKLLQEQLPVWDKKKQALRSIEPRDIAVLARTWSPLEIYGQALEQLQIPFIQSNGGNLLETREAKDAIALLRFLANPADALALVAVLRSPFFSLSDRLLYEIRPTDKTQKWWQQLQASQKSECLYAVTILQKLLKERDLQSPSRLLQEADRLTGYTAVITNLPKSQRRLADWRGVLNMVRQLEMGMADVLTVSRRLQRLIPNQSKINRPPLEAQNAVTLMTIHSSKGLEWSVVIVPDLTRQQQNSTSSILFDPQLGVATKHEDENGEKQKSALYILLEQQQRQQQEDEAKRLLYVALTRARDRLILTAPKDKGNAFDLLKPILEEKFSIQEIDSTKETYFSQSVTISEPTQIPKIILLNRVRSNSLDLPITALTEYARCPQQFYYHYIAGNIGFTSGKTHYSAEIGSLTHKALEKDFSQAEQLKFFSPNLPNAVREEAINLATKFNQTSIYDSVRQGIWECHLKLKLGHLNFNGYADLVGEDFILDIKTDQERHPEVYRLQLWAYATAAKKQQAHIAYLRHDHLHTFSADDLQVIGQEALTISQAIADQQYSPAPSPSNCQFCQYQEICEASIVSP